MPVIPEDYAQVTHIFSGVNLPNGGAIVYGIQNQLDFTAQTIADACGTIFSTDVLPRLTSDVSLARTDAKLGPNDTGTSASSNNGAGPGAQSASSEPPNTAYLVTKSSALGGRRGKGRIFLPGVDAGNVDDAGTVNPVLVAAFQTELTDWLDHLATTDIPMHLLHDYPYTWALVGGQPRRIPDLTDPPPIPSVVVSLTLQTTVATQRRRLR